MGSRIVATVVAFAALGVLLWVAFGGNSTESASEVPKSAASDTAATATAAPMVAMCRGSAASPLTAGTALSCGDESPEQTSTPEPAAAAPENFGPRMDLVDIDGWLNTDATSIDAFDGKVLLVEMWTFGCFNCKARIPFNQSYYEEFGGEDFEILGVHAPEFSYEADVDNIVAAAEDLGVNWPIALDTDKRNFRAWQSGTTSYWPRTYVIDQNGDIRYDHIGEGKYEELRETIRYLIENPPPPATNS